MDDRGCFLQGGVFVLEELQEGSRQSRHVPDRDVGLVAVGIAALLVDAGEDAAHVEIIHEGAGTIVDRLAADSAVVGVHDAVDEAEGHPLRDEICLGHADGAEQVHRASRIRVVAVDRVVGESAQVVDLATMGKDLERAHAQVAGGCAGEDCTGQHPLFAQDVFACGHSSEGAGGGDAEGVHRLGDHIFAQNWAKPCAAIAATRIGGAA